MGGGGGRRQEGPGVECVHNVHRAGSMGAHPIPVSSPPPLNIRPPAPACLLSMDSTKQVVLPEPL